MPHIYILQVTHKFIFSNSCSLCQENLDVAGTFYCNVKKESVQGDYHDTNKNEFPLNGDFYGI